jgi:hypothetical protein
MPNWDRGETIRAEMGEMDMVNEGEETARASEE